MGRCDVKIIGIVALLVLAVAVQPVAAQSSWQRFVDSVLPPGIRHWLGGSPPPAPTPEARRILSTAEILKLEKPVEGSVGPGEVHVLRMTFPPSGEDYPNILLTLSVLNDDGDADIYCIPEYLFKISNKSPTRSFSVWRSDHAHGADHIFISRNHELYEDSKTGNEETPDGVSFICSVVGFATGGSDYVLAVDLDYTERSLIPREMAAMRNLFDECCLGSPASCQPWKGTTAEDGSISMDFCHIPGSVCNGDGNLIRLDLSSLQMQCEFPTAAIAKLKKLEKLNLADNEIEGDIAEILESLRMKTETLQMLNLKGNLIKGSISEEKMGAVPLCELTNSGSLAFLNLGGNEVSGPLPACLFTEESKLRELTLDGNPIGGELPEVSPDSQLQALRLVKTGLSGSIPAAFGDLKSLIVINLADNALEGSIPENLGAAETLLSVSLSKNQLSGEIPGSLVSGTHLRHLRLDQNALESFGEEWYTPGWLDMSKVLTIDCGMNAIQGEFPESLTTAPLLRILGLDENKLTGPLPDEPGMFPSVVVLLLSGNAFSGSIPEALADAGFFSEQVRRSTPYLPEFDLAKNELTGDIPEFLHAGSVPEFLWEQIRLGGNKFDIPCPLPVHLVHIKDLVCENGDSPIDETPVDVTIVGDLADVPPAVALAPAPEPVPVFDDEDLPMSDGPLYGPSAEDIELVTAELASADPTETSGGDSLVRSRRGRGIPLSSVGSGGSVEEPTADSGTTSQKAGTSIFILVGACFLLVLVATVVIAAVYRRRQHSKKSDIVSEVMARDLEMQNTSEIEEADNVRMLQDAKPSAAVL